MIWIWILAGVSASYIYWNETRRSLYPITENGPWIATVMIFMCIAFGLVSLAVMATYAIVKRLG